MRRSINRKTVGGGAALLQPGFVISVKKLDYKVLPQRSRARSLIGSVRNMSVRDVGDRFSPIERGPFTIREKRRLAPGAQRVQPMLGLRGSALHRPDSGKTAWNYAAEENAPVARNV